MRSLKTNEINLNEVLALTVDQAKARYNVGANTLFKISDQAGANIRYGSKKRLYNRAILDEYFSLITDW